MGCHRVFAFLSAGADTKANTIWGGGALQLLEHTVPLDTARDNDSGGNAQVVREVDLLGRRCALELVDLKRVPVDTAKEACGEWGRNGYREAVRDGRVSTGADTKGIL